MNNNGQILIDMKNVCKYFHRGTETVHAVDDISLSIKKGEFCSIVGPSGSGKTSLMNLMGCIDQPTSGMISICEREVQKEGEQQLTLLRQKTIGFVFQQFFLVPTLTVLENVQLPTLFTRTYAEHKGKDILERVGLSHRWHHLPNQLSGGEMQRVAIARSLINDPLIVLADEPTGNLDSKNAEIIIGLFEQLNQDGMTVVLVTHNSEISKRCKRVVRIEDGKIQS